MKLKEIKKYYDREEMQLEMHYFVDYYSKRQGDCKIYSQIGDSLLIVPFKDDKLHGIRRFFISYKNSESDGIWYFKNDNSFGQQKPK